MLNLVLSPDTTELAALRASIRDWAGQRGIPEWPLTLIATELAANAIAVTPPSGRIEVSVAERGGDVEISVADPGPGFEEPIDLDRLALPPPEDPRGRGLFLVQQLSSELRARRSGDLTVVSACRPRAAP